MFRTGRQGSGGEETGNQGKSLERVGKGASQARKPSTIPTARQKSHAKDLTARMGIPSGLALDVACGRKTLNEVLQTLWAIERRESLVKKGLERSLAGAVARNRLPEHKAKTIQEVFDRQQVSFHSKRLNALLGREAALFLFGHGCVMGRVEGVSRYDFTFRESDGSDARTLKQHDIKYFCEPVDAKAVATRIEHDEAVASLGLQASSRMQDRFRPTQALALQWLEAGHTMRFFLRDGDVVQGLLRRVSLFEVDLELDGGRVLTIMTHALLRDRPCE